MNQTKSSVSLRKALIRKKIKSLKLSAAVRRAKSAKLNSKIIKSKFFRKAETIGFYAALPDEINVLAAAKKALKLGKQVFFPRMYGKKIEFRAVRNFKKDLKSGRHGILEPVLSRTKKRSRELDLIIIPGRAFDKKGRRLGRGVGYYDRLLAKWCGSIRMGVAFREQIVKQIPAERHDMNMYVVLTD